MTAFNKIRVKGSDGKNFYVWPVTEMQSAINKMREEMEEHIPQPDLSHDEILRLVAPAQYREALAVIREIAATSGIDNYTRLPWYPKASAVHGERTCIEVQIWVNDVPGVPGSLHPLLPLYPMVQEDAPKEIFGKIDAWADTMFKIRIGFRRANRVLEELHERLHSPAQVRYAWPGILPIMRRCWQLVPMANELERNRTTNIDPLPIELRMAIPKASAMITSALLLQDVKPIRDASVKVPVLLEMGRVPEFVDEDGFKI